MNLDLYRKLFVHRSDVYAVQQTEGMYFPAGRGHWDDRKFVYDEYFPLNDDELQEHLDGFASYGTYVVRPECDPSHPGVPDLPHTVKYLVFDLDSFSPELYEALTNSVEALVRATKETGPYPDEDTYKCLLLERSGGKGFHAWLFLSEPLPARQVRAWVQSNFSPTWNILSDSSELEIFPKQDAVEPGGFGNLVKLPFGVHAKTGNRSEIVSVQGWANSVEEVQGLDSALVPVASAATPEASSPAMQRSEDGAKLPPFPCVAKIMQEGCGQGNRDNAMFHLALYFADQGVPFEPLMQLCSDANESFHPPMHIREVRTKVLSALRAPHGSCRPDWLRGFCPGGEGCFAPGSRTKQDTRRPAPARQGSYWNLSPEERRKLRLRGTDDYTD